MRVATKKKARFVKDGRFVAEYDGDASLHFEKSIQLAEIADSSGCFVSPQPISLSDQRDTIEWEFLFELRPIRQALPKFCFDTQIEMAGRIGATLATIHRELRLPGDEFSPDGLLAEIGDNNITQHVAETMRDTGIHNVHGDFACANIFVDADDRIVTLDPEPNVYVFNGAIPSIRTSRYVEVGLLIQSLQSNGAFCRTLRNRVEAISASCLAGYERHAEFELDRQTVYALAAAIMNVYRSYRLHDGTESLVDRWAAGRFRKRQARSLLNVAKKHAVSQSNP